VLAYKAGLGKFEVMESMPAGSGNDRTGNNPQNSHFVFAMVFCSKDIIK